MRGLVDRYPTRERLWALLMTALYGAGRRDEAVSTYAEARATLADELGIEPGAALQQLQAGMLRNDPELGGDPAVVQPRRRARVPTLTSSTFGRDELTAEVADLLLRDDVRLVSLTGIGGSGKSRVATLVATAVEERFADVVFLQVTEAIGSAQLPLEVALALEVDTKLDLGDALDALGPEWRGLVVLDNLEALEEGDRVVRRLLDASGPAHRAGDQPAAAAARRRAGAARASPHRPGHRRRAGDHRHRLLGAAVRRPGDVGGADVHAGGPGA